MNVVAIFGPIDLSILKSKVSLYLLVYIRFDLVYIIFVYQCSTLYFLKCSINNVKKKGRNFNVEIVIILTSGTVLLLFVVPSLCSCSH